MAIQNMATMKNQAAEKNQAIRSDQGFTLLEMIIAVTLVAIMAVGIWSIFRIGIRSWSRGTVLIDTSQRHRNILDMVRKQMASAYPLAAPPDMDTSEMENSGTEIPGLAYPIFYGTKTSLYFISLNSLNFHVSPGLTLVNYNVEPGMQGDYSLVERENRYLGQLPDAENSNDVSRPISLFSNLTDCYFEYRSDSDEEDSELWVQEWDAQEEGTLPVAISLTMVSTDTNGNTRNRNIFVPIHANAGNTQTNILNISNIRGGIGRGRGGLGRELNSEARDELLREIDQRIRSGSGREPGSRPRRRLEQRPGNESERRFDREFEGGRRQ